MSWQHPSRTGPSRWRGSNHGFHDNVQQDLADRRMAHLVDPVPGHHTSQERQPAAVPELPNNQPHQPSKQSLAEDHVEKIEATSGNIMAEEQAGFRAGRSTRQQIFNLRILCEKQLQHQQNLYHVFIDMVEFLRRGLTCSIAGNQEDVQHEQQPYPSYQNLYDKATSAVLFNGSIGGWSRTTVGVRQECLLSPTLFSIIYGKDHDRRLKRS